MAGRYTYKALAKDCFQYLKNAVETHKAGWRMEIVNQKLGMMLFDFKKPETIKEFELISDFDFGGKSWGTLSTSKHGRMVFHGNLDKNVPEKIQHEIHKSGFVGIRSYPKYTLFNKIDILDISWYDCVEIKYRGDGRPYFLNIQSSIMNAVDHKYELYQSFLYTKGGPYWEVERIPFSKFLRTFQSYYQDVQPEFNKLKTIGITICDRKSGPFRLEIESIKLVHIGHQPPTFKTINHPRFQPQLYDSCYKEFAPKRELTEKEEADRRRRLRLPPLPPKEISESPQEQIEDK